MITISSNRIYKDILKNEYIDYINETIILFNQAKIKTYSLLSKGVETNVVRDIISKDYGLNNYYESSTYTLAKGLISSNEELRKLYINNTEEEIKKVKKKITSKKRELTIKRKLLESVIDIHKAHFKGEVKPLLYNYFKMKESYDPIKNMYYLEKGKGKNKKIIEYNPYDFEVCYLKPLIKRIKSNLGWLKFKLDKLEDKLKKLHSNEIRSCFGSKDLFKKQFTLDRYIDNHELWKEDFYKRRFNSFQVAGRKDAKQGNFVFRYDGNTLKFRDIKNRDILLNNVVFPYRGDDLKVALNISKDKRKAICWTLEDHGDYYLIKASFHPVIDTRRVNYSREEGLIGLDINYDHLAWSEINKEGNLIDCGIIPMKLDGSTNYNAKVIENAIVKLFKLCKNKKKPLGMEDLNLKSVKRSLLYGTKECNLKISSFSYNKITTAIESRAIKDEIGIFKINPAYTSMFGKIKYMKAKGLNIHISASFTIARRAFGIKEKIPQKYRKLTNGKYEKRNKSIYKNIKNIKTHEFYKNHDFTNFKDIKDLKSVMETY